MYTENPMVAAEYRANVLRQFAMYLDKERIKCAEERSNFFTPDTSSVEAYQKSVDAYREQFIEMLGKPLTQFTYDVPANHKTERLSDEEDFTIDRLWVECMPDVWSYGLLFTPKGDEKYPLIIASHGGWGTPEMICSVTGCDNYNDIVQRILKKTRTAIYAPQLMLWNDSHARCDMEKVNGPCMSTGMTQVGGSLASFEITKIRKTLSWLLANKNIDETKVGMCGLSYGGFYTLMTTAADTRIKTCLSIAQFNDRIKYNWHDWVWFNSAGKFMDSEIARLVCPRKLIVQVGKTDHLFDWKTAEKTSVPVAETYKELGIGDYFTFHMHEGEHEVDKDDRDIDLFLANLLN